MMNLKSGAMRCRCAGAVDPEAALTCDTILGTGADVLTERGVACGEGVILFAERCLRDQSDPQVTCSRVVEILHGVKDRPITDWCLRHP